MIQTISKVFCREFSWINNSLQTNHEGGSALASDLANHLLELLLQRLSEAGDEKILKYLIRDKKDGSLGNDWNLINVGDPSIGFASFVDAAYSVCLLESSFFATQTKEQRDEICHQIASVFLRTLSEILEPADRTALLSELPHDIKLHFDA